VARRRFSRHESRLKAANTNETIPQMVRSEIASCVQDRLAAEQTKTWLRKLADNLAEVEGDTPEAFQKRRELVQLLVEKITADRDEDGRARVSMTYTFGPPPEDPFVSSVGNSTVFLTHHAL
jgi:hypothetical protein